MRNILVAITITNIFLSMLFFQTALGYHEDPLSGYTFVDKLQEGQEIPFVAWNPGISDKVNLSIGVCSYNNPVFSTAIFKISSSKEAKEWKIDWQYIKADDYWHPISKEMWCIEGQNVIRGSDVVQRSDIGKDVTVTYVGSQGYNIEEASKMHEERIKQQLEEKKAREKSVTIMGLLPHQLPNRFYVDFDVCASGNESLYDPIISVSSDTEEIRENIFAVMAPLTCNAYETIIVAQDPKSITVNFAEDKPPSNDSLHKLVEQLQKENESLKEQLAKKDAVLMEQLKVISDLAKMIKKVVFDSFMQFLQV